MRDAAVPVAVVPEPEAASGRPPAVAVFDADWTLVAVDQATADLLGRRREELVGRNIWIALPEFAGTIFHSFLLHAGAWVGGSPGGASTRPPAAGSTRPRSGSATGCTSR